VPVRVVVTFLAIGLAAFLLLGLSVVADLPGERSVKEALGFEYGEPAACNKVPGRGPEGDWREETALESLRDEARAVTVGDGVYIVGGLEADDPPPGRSVATFERYDLRTRRYEQLPPLPMALNHVGMATHDGDIYVAGGQGEDRGSVIATDRAWRYRPEEERWEELAPMAERRGALGLTVAGDRLLAIGGRVDRTFSDEPSVAAVEAYDIAADRWSRVSSLPEPRDHLGATTLDGQVYVFGGRLPDGSPQPRLDRYNPASGEWTRLADAPVGTSGIDLLPAGDALITAGGERPPDGEVLGGAWSYSVADDRWEDLPALPTPRHGYASVIARDRFYVFGGSTCPGFEPTADAASLPLELG
jgi:hypothetical protein